MIVFIIIYVVFYIAAYELKTGALYPATFLDRGPDVDIRSASHFAEGCEVVQSLCACVCVQPVLMVIHICVMQRTRTVGSHLSRVPSPGCHDFDSSGIASHKVREIESWVTSSHVTTCKLIELVD